MQIPKTEKRLHGWTDDLIRACTADRTDRIARSIAYRNLFLTGDANGIPQTFLRTQDYIEDLLSFIYSPVDLRFAISYYGQVSPVERAKGDAASADLYQHVRSAGIDTACEDCTLWSLINGKMLMQLLYSRGGLEAWPIDPVSFGVLRPDIPDLSRQEAFTHTTFLTRSRFADMISTLPSDAQARILKGVTKYLRDMRDEAVADQNSVLRQIMVGGIAPYTAQGQQQPSQGGFANWLTAPQPIMRSEVVEKLVAVDWLWAWDSQADDWATFAKVGNVPVFGFDQQYNAFAVQYDPRNDERVAASGEDNPLKGKHGFVEFCPYRMKDYFWGRSATQSVALLQEALNMRIDGINTMLRKQEDPPRWARGFQGVNQNALAKLKRPGGWYADNNPNAQINDLEKQIPADIWRSFHELNNMFDIVGGMPAVMRGEGEGSVRSQGHADTLMRTGAARHKKPALAIERSIEEVAGVCLDLLRARSTDIITAWVKPGTKSVEIPDAMQADPSLEPPAEGMLPVPFQYHHLSDRARIKVDNHSASPAFSFEARQLAFALAGRGAMSPQRLVQATHPTNEDELIEDAERAEIARAQFLAQHPEAAKEHGRKR